MTKPKVKPPVLYDHNTTQTVHRNLTVTDNGRRLRTETNIIESPHIPITQPPAAPFFYDEPLPNEPYFYDDDHFPACSDEPDRIDTFKVTAMHKAKRYQNSVSL